MIGYDWVRYRYPERDSDALRDFTWQVEAGTSALITGPSGAGKSTLLRCLNGLVPHFHGGVFGGRVTVAGIDTRFARTADLSRRVGFVAQDPETQTVMDRVADEIAFGPENHGLPRGEIRLRVEEALDLVGIPELRDREIASLSGGERQRVVIAAAIAMRPEVLALDEPTSQLDPLGAELVLDVLARLNAELGTTIILAEHHVDRVIHRVERLLILDSDSTVVADGPPALAARSLAHPPPLIRVALARGWEPLPLSVRDARRFVARLPAPVSPSPSEHAPDHASAPVELERVSFAYDGHTALREVSASFAAGSVTALLGRNGAGKTTLLKQVNGLLRPRSGQIRVQGRDIRDRATQDLAREVGYLPQNPNAMLFNRTVAGELEFTLRCLGERGDIPGTLGALGLGEYAERSPLDLSSGERQRLALAAVLVGRPSILLLDEPTRGLDLAWKDVLADLLRRLAADGVTIIIATHDVELVAACGDRALVLANGEVIADGPPRQVLTGSLSFATQLNRVFGGDILTVADLDACAAVPAKG